MDDPLDGVLVGKDDVTFTPHLPLADTRREQAAVDMALGKLSQRKIAAALGITPDTLRRWLTAPEVNARVMHLRAEITQTMMQHGIANREMRLMTLQEMHEDYVQIARERADAAMSDPKAQHIPGATTGRLTMEIKKIGYGDHAERIEEWKLDRSVHTSILEIEERMARETGQWSEKTESTSETVVRVFKGVDVDKV